MLLCAANMLRHMHLEYHGNLISNAVEKVIKAGKVNICTLFPTLLGFKFSYLGYSEGWSCEIIPFSCFLFGIWRAKHCYITICLPSNFLSIQSSGSMVQQYFWQSPSPYICHCSDMFYNEFMRNDIRSYGNNSCIKMGSPWLIVGP